ncbi:Arm DNA-binding domain-containing protein [Pseudanabaena sp. PCC 6802]|uniref:Arm DNA-binding domain-containing protein n=1 Tax=Pseudanabaena sp. PCC 6802 TaxID=118173 RepID=UPI000345E6B1|nr:DUF3596 domain-containing protein [Pseudanabaena sp. PCC 6802]
MTVWIESNDDRLRLRWHYQGKRYGLSLGVDDNATGRAVAKQKAATIEVDIAAGYFDSTLMKYSPKTIGKSAIEVNVPDLFDRYVEAIAKEKNLTNRPLAD